MNSDTRPIYIRLADQISDRILVGEYREWERIPSVREYASSQQVNPATAARAFENLEREGVIFNKRGLGYFVSANASEIIKKIRLKTLLGEESKLFFARMESIDVSPDQLKSMYQDYLSSSKK